MDAAAALVEDRRQFVVSFYLLLRGYSRGLRALALNKHYGGCAPPSTRRAVAPVLELTGPHG